MLATRLFSIPVRSISSKTSVLTALREKDLEALKREVKKEMKAERQLKTQKYRIPVLPRNPVNLYLSERSQDPDIKNLLKFNKSVHVLSQLFKDYKNLTQEEQNVYVQKREQDKERFREEFSAWYENILNDPQASEEIRQQASKKRAKYAKLNYI